jgi:hypothetical protein
MEQNRTTVIERLDKLAHRLREIHLQNPRPAQPEGLWEHHIYKFGLLKHSENLNKILTAALIHELNSYIEASKSPVNIPIDILVKIFEVFALAHDIAKVYGYDGYDHAEKSYQITRQIIEETVSDLDPEIKEIILLMVRYHHLNFADPQAFSKRGEGYFDPVYFPFVLAAIAADMLSIACDQLIDGLK